MNGWDLFTWFNCVLLAGAAVVIFSFFCKDAGGILKGHREDSAGDPATAPYDGGKPAPGSDPT